MLSISKFKVRELSEKKRFGAVYVKKLKEDPTTLLSTVLIMNNLANTAAAAIMTSISILYFESNAIGIATGIATFLILVFGDIIPKSIGANNNEAIAPIMAPIVWHISIIILPLIKVLGWIVAGVNKIIGTKKSPLMTKEELKSILKYSEEVGSIKESEKKLIQRIFDFGNTTVSDVMTPKKHMVIINSDMPVKDAVSQPTTKIYSRFPVYEKNKDNIVGILYLKDVIGHIKDGKLDVPVKQVMRKPFFVFDTKKLDSMLRLFQSRKEHMAVVISNKAHVVGLVTIENILEEIVGEIIDESDRINPSIAPTGKNEWTAKGSAEIANVNANTGLSVRESDFNDLDSFIIATLGRAPKPGEELSYQNYRILMEDVQGKKVLKAKIIKV